MRLSESGTFWNAWPCWRVSRSRMDVRRAAVGTVFGLHTFRFRIYLQSDHGLRHTSYTTPGEGEQS